MNRDVFINLELRHMTDIRESSTPIGMQRRVIQGDLWEYTVDIQHELYCCSYAGWQVIHNDVSVIPEPSHRWEPEPIWNYSQLRFSRSDGEARGEKKI